MSVLAARRAVRRVSPRYLLRHSFSGAALTPSDFGPSLSAFLGTPVVAGGVLTPTDATGVRVRALGLPATVVAQARVNFGNSAGTDRRVQIAVRGINAAGSRYQMLFYRSANTINLQRVDAGVGTNIAVVPTTLADSTNYWVRIAICGSRIEASYSTDGAVFSSVAVVTDATYPVGSDVEFHLVDNVALPTIQVDDLLVWTV